MSKPKYYPRLACWQIGEGGFVGYITVSVPTGPVLDVVKATPLLEVTDLYVHPLRRGQGWAGQLMQHATDYADRKGATLALYVSSKGYTTPGRPYEALKAFYRGFGFRTVPVRNPDKLTYRMPLDSIMRRQPC